MLLKTFKLFIVVFTIFAFWCFYISDYRIVESYFYDFNLSFDFDEYFWVLLNAFLFVIPTLSLALAIIYSGIYSPISRLKNSDVDIHLFVDLILIGFLKIASFLFTVFILI